MLEIGNYSTNEKGTFYTVISVENYVEMFKSQDKSREK